MGKLYYKPDYYGDQDLKVNDDVLYEVWFQISADCYKDKHIDENGKYISPPNDIHAGMELVSSASSQDDYMVRCYGSFLSESDLLLELDIWYAEEQKDKDDDIQEVN